MFELLGPARIILVFREPIDRLFSYYKYLHRDNMIAHDISFDQYATIALRTFNSLPITQGARFDVYTDDVFLRGVIDGFYADYMDDWYCTFEEGVTVIFFDHIVDNPQQIMRGLCKSLRLNYSIYDTFIFTVENKGIRPRNRVIHRIGEDIFRHLEPFLWRHHSLKRFLRKLYSYVNINSNTGLPILSDVTLNLLQSLYVPYNTRLSKILTSHGYSNLPGWLRTGK